MEGLPLSKENGGEVDGDGGQGKLGWGEGLVGEVGGERCLGWKKINNKNSYPVSKVTILPLFCLSVKPVE